MKYLKNTLYLFIILLFTSCEDNSVPFGTVEYYPSFLWVDSNITPVKKTIEFDFSKDAQIDSKTYAELQFVDNNGKPISTNVMQVSDGKQTFADNKIRVGSDVKIKELIFTFSPTAESGKHQGYIKLVNHNLDRIDSQELNPGDTVDVVQWTLYYNKIMNPLELGLLWALGIVITAIALWKVFLIRLIYPRFKAINKMIVIPNQAPINIRFRGARMVVIDNVKHKQSLWDCFWKGKIIYKCNPSITSPITLKPRKRGREILFVANTTNYHCTPNPIGMRPSKVTDVINNKQIDIL